MKQYIHKLSVILFIIFLAKPSYAHNSLEAGIYTCINGNNDSICDQEITPIFKDGSLQKISVNYVGYCGNQGPYTYYCQTETECAGPFIQYSQISSKSYLWENTSYGFYCHFEKK